MGLLDRTGDRAGGAYTRAGGASAALVLEDRVGEKVLADACRASLLGDVRDVLVAEIAEGRKDRVRSGLTESAEGSVLYVSGEFLEAVDVFKLTLAVGDLRRGSREDVWYRYGRARTYRRTRRR